MFGAQTRVAAGDISFSAPVQTSPEAHPAFCTLSAGSFQGLKRPERETEQPASSSAEFKNEYIYTSIPPIRLQGWYTGKTLSFTSKMLVRLYQSVRCHITSMFLRDTVQSETQRDFPFFELKLRVLVSTFRLKKSAWIFWREINIVPYAIG